MYAIRSYYACVVITDDITSKKEEWEALKASEFGYIIMKADSMIGARREFLDPISYNFV